MRRTHSQLVLLFCLGMSLGISLLRPNTSVAVCTINPSGTYIEAENFSGYYNRDNYTNDNDWFIEDSETGTNGGKVLISGDGGSAANEPSKEVKEYLINFPTAGTYHIWMRGMGDDGSHDSMFFTIDNRTWKAWNFGGIYDKYIWTSSMQVGSDNTIYVASAGDHTIKIAMRESDSIIDGFYITTGNEIPNDNVVPSSVTTVDPKAGCTGPQWTVAPQSLGPTCFFGYNAAPMSFTLTNIGINDTTSATVSSNQTWAVPVNSTISALNTNGSFTVTLNFLTAALAVGTYQAEITVAGAASNSPLKIPITLLVKDVPATAACGKIPLYAQNLVNPAIMVQLDTSGSMGTNMTIAVIADQETPDLRTIVQEIISRGEWAANNSMAFVFSGTGKRRAWSYDGQSANVPTLSITYTKDGVTTTIERTISSSNNDAQKSGTTLNTTETYLELGRSNEPVGLVFSDIAVPAGATITNAVISFSAYQGDTTATSLTIKGVAADNITSLTLTELSTLTTASNSWSPGSWSQTMSRINIAEDVLKEVFLDRTIAWGFATWDGGSGGANNSDNSPDYYTKYLIGIHAHDDTHQTQLQNKADDGSPGSYTPLVPAMKAGLAYFQGDRNDEYYNARYQTLDCQPRILVLITDGEGNTATDDAKIDSATDALIAGGVSVVTVGFGLTTTAQLDRIVQKMQTPGEQSDDDYLYSLHNKNASGVAVPFMAQNRQEFIDAMNGIVSNVKAQIFHGSSPAPTTSVDNGEILLNASFNASDWSGDLTATRFNAYTGTLAATPLWSAKAQMPATTNGFIYDSAATSKVIPYTDACIAGDNFLCKKLGDIINSTPAIVGKPPYFYKFDNYFTFKYNATVRTRDAIAYVGSNDGALHAFKLSDGSEKWRFYPDSVKSKMALATTSPQNDMCSTAFCHKFLLDGSPEPADIYAAGSWKTILTTGLGEGGSAYFALDVTHGQDFKDTTTNPSKFLWEFTRTDDDKIGLATSWPTHARVPNGSGFGWATFFGSGKEEVDLLQADKEAYLFAVNSWDKSRVWKDSTDASVYKVKLSSTTLKNDFPAPPLVIESRVQDYVADRIYLGNQYGNMYRVKNLGFAEIAESNLLYNAQKSDHSTPVTAKAEYANVGNGDLWIYFGTGSYLNEVDKSTLYQQYFLGLFDQGAAKATPYVQNDLVKATTDIIQGYALDKDGNTVDLNNNGTAGDAGDLQKFRTLSCTSPDAQGRCNPNNNSWLLQLAIPAGSKSERVISQPLVVAGIVFFTTFVPNGDVCAGNGETWLFAVDWKTGEYVTNAVFDINKDGSFDSADQTVRSGTETKKIAGIFVGDGKPSGEIAIHNDLLFVGTTGQPPRPIKVNLPDMQAKLRSWLQVSD